jgi:hypothetical protein
MIKKLALFFMLLTVALSLMPSYPCSANAAEPPSVIIIVPNAPEDLEIELGYTNVKARRTDKVVESYFCFYNYELKQSFDYTLRVKTGDGIFEVTPDFQLDSYNNVFTLNLEDRTLTPGKPLAISIALPALRILLTLAIEAGIFWLFGYRDKRSWIAFLVINLITQAFVNIWLISGFNPLQSYMVLMLIFAEILVFIFELIAFLIVIKEHGKLRTAGYVMAANLLSLVAGGYLITVLPV